MTLTVRLPLKVEQQLAEYCVERKITKSNAVKLALDGLLGQPATASPHDLGADLFGAGAEGKRKEVDVARHSKRLLRERFRGGA